MPLVAQDITSTDEAWFIDQHLERHHHANRSPLDYYLHGATLDPLDCHCNLALAILGYNRTDFPRAMVYTTQTLKCAHTLNKNPQRGQASLIRASTYECQGQYWQVEEDFWRAAWSDNGKAGGYYGLARPAARNGNFDTSLDFCQQSFHACPTNQEVLCPHNLLLALSGHQDSARLQREELLHDCLLNTTLWWLNWFDGRSESALVQR